MRRLLTILLLAILPISCKNEGEKSEVNSSHQTEKLNKKVDEYFSAGTYSFAAVGNLELTLKVENENLVVYQDGGQKATLKAESDYTLQAAYRQASLHISNVGNS
jgi:hypothetical protein